MKKIFTLLLASGISVSSFSQEVSPDPTLVSGPAVTKTVAKTPSRYSRHNQDAGRAAKSLWLCYAEATDMLSGGSSVSNPQYLFTDSLPYANFGGTYDRPWVHHIGNCLDASSLIYDASGYATGHTWPKSLAYTVDSMSIRHLYIRTNPNPAIVDTLIARIYTNVNNVSSYYYSPPYASTMPGGALSTDSLWYKQQFFNPTTGIPASNISGAALNGAITVKIPLTIADTADFFWGDLDFEIPGGLVVPSTRVALSTFTYKPGVAYTLADTIGGSKVNQFNFNSYEENGANTYPSYWPPCYSPFVGTCDWNCSSIIRTQERYDINTTSNYRFLPSYGFVQGFVLEQHVIRYKVTSSTVGIEEATTLNGVKLGQNQPNPFNGNTVISYEIPVNETVSLDIFDIAGKKIVSLNQGKQSAGTHTIEVSSQNLPQGVYFYTLNVGTQNVTKKMTVVE